MGPPASLGEALRAGKKFSRRILRDTVGTCPQIISWRHRRARGFTAGLWLLPLSGRDSALRCPPKAFGAARRPYRSPRGRRARRFSSRFHHCGPNRAYSLGVCTSRPSGTGRTLLLNWGFSFHGPGSFSNSRIRHRSALDIRLARFRWLRSRSFARSTRSACPSRAHFFKRQIWRGRLLLTRLGFAWRWCWGFWSKLFRRLRCSLGKLGFLFASNDYFLRMYFSDENDTAEYCPEKSFHMMPPDQRFSPFTTLRSW